MRENTRLDEEIRATMKKDFPLPPNVKKAQEAAFAQIRRQVQEGKEKEEQQERQKTKGRVFVRSFAGLAAAAALFLVICIADPAFAAQIPLVGRVFEAVGDSLGFSGDYSKYAEPVRDADEMAAETDETAAEENGALPYSQTENGVTITLSEVYCNDAALYISMVIKSESGFPETMCDLNEKPMLQLWDSTLTFDYNPEKCPLAYGDGDRIDGKFVDSHTFAGVVRYDLSASEDASDREGFEKEKDRFIQSLGITQQEIDTDIAAAEDRACQILGIDELTDEALARAGGPDWKDYQKKAEVPEDFKVQLSIPMVLGGKAQVTTPQMPEDLREEYEQAMKAQGLGVTDEDYAGFTDEQKETEHRLFQDMWNKYGLRFPKTNEHPNEYENWWVDGPWEFSLDVAKNREGTVVKEFGDLDENGMGLVSVTKTPFEITIDDGQPGADYFMVALDADGDILDYGSSSNTNTFAIQDRDVSRIDVYICDYVEYMDELKGYYWSEDYESRKKEKTFKQLLDERALYHKEVVFGE